MIANAIDEDDLKYLVERKINNRSSIELTDLHELYLCILFDGTIHNILTIEICLYNGGGL